MQLDLYSDTPAAIIPTIRHPHHEHTDAGVSPLVAPLQHSSNRFPSISAEPLGEVHYAIFQELVSLQ